MQRTITKIPALCERYLCFDPTP